MINSVCVLRVSVCGCVFQLTFSFPFPFTVPFPFPQTMATGGPPPKKPREECLPVTHISSIHVEQRAVTVRARLTNKSTFLPEDWYQYSFVELLDGTGEIRCGYGASEASVFFRRLTEISEYERPAGRPWSRV